MRQIASASIDQSASTRVCRCGPRGGHSPISFRSRERQFVWRVAVNLVCGHMDKRSGRHKAARCFKEIDRAHGVGIKILERYFRRQIVTWLRCTVHNRGRTQSINQAQYTVPVADIQFVMHKIRQLDLEPMLIPSRVALRPEKACSRVVIDPVNLPSASSEVCADFRADQTRRSCNK